MFRQVQMWCAIPVMCTDSSLKEGHVYNHVNMKLNLLILELFHCEHQNKICKANFLAICTIDQALKGN